MLKILNKSSHLLNLVTELSFPNYVKINEIGMTYGIQKKDYFIPTTKKINIINKLSHSNIKNINITNYVSSKKINQMKDHREIYRNIQKLPNVNYNVLIPNLQGLNTAIMIMLEMLLFF